jgi:hypothetical protein
METCKDYYIFACRRYHDFAEVVDNVVLLLRNIVWEFFMALTLLVRQKHGELLNNMQEVLMRSSGE